MELDLALSNVGRHLTREATVTLARAAEELGFASVWTSEHLVVPAQLLDQLRAYEAAGVDELVIDFMDQEHGGVPDLPDMVDQLRRFADLVAVRRE